MKKIHLGLRDILNPIITLSSEKVLVRANPHPCPKARRIIPALVPELRAGWRAGQPEQVGNLIPYISTLTSTMSMGE